MMIDMDDPDHWGRRKLVNRGFTPKRVRASEERIRDVCDEIIDAVCERGECDFVWDIAAPLPLIMIGDALGVAPEDRADLMRWSDDMLRGLTDEPGALMPAADAFEGYMAYASRVIAGTARRACAVPSGLGSSMSIIIGIGPGVRPDAPAFENVGRILRHLPKIVVSGDAPDMTIEIDRCVLSKSSSGWGSRPQTRH